MFKQSTRLFSTTNALRSHIGSSPVFVSPDVKISIENLLKPKVIPKGARSIKFNKLLTIKGPKGILDLELPDFLKLHAEEGKIAVNITNTTDKIQKALWGTMRALINNNVIGVTEGHSSTLRFQGTGYRVSIQEIEGVKWVQMKIGKCNLQGLPIPEGITCSAPTQTLLILEGCDKQQLNLFAGRLRNFHPPEPYKGKGIYFNGETVKLKSKKVK
ncbi:unnamed protein product [Ambrosiozyma monospora]|uniref:Unnamed protein product n=1 Tax=Ambrosiozyma monospora TaxID=43982 RepID=A0ACB5U9M6_AMBMO|nr:unnamed protein product [Ambrosiozyma monospora]